MARDLLNSRTDEVARNGAFWKKLRPEVLPDAPLQFATQSGTPFGSLAALPRRCKYSTGREPTARFFSAQSL